MAAPTFVGVDARLNAAGGGSGTAWSMAWSELASAATDDVAILFGYRETTAAFTATPAGWNHAAGYPVQQNTGGFKYEADVWWRRVSGDSGTITWSWSGSTWVYWEVVLYRGAITSETPLLSVTADEETAQNTQPSHPGITIARSNSALVYAIFNFTSSTVSTPPTGFVVRADTTPGNREIYTYDDLTTVTGASGAVAATLGDPEYALTILLELATEAAAGGGTKAKPPFRRQWRVWSRRA